MFGLGLVVVMSIILLLVYSLWHDRFCREIVMMKQLNRNHVFGLGLAVAVSTILVFHYFKNTPVSAALPKGVEAAKGKDTKQVVKGIRLRREAALIKLKAAVEHLDRASWQAAVAKSLSNDARWQMMTDIERNKAWVEVRRATNDLSNLD